MSSSINFSLSKVQRKLIIMFVGLVFVHVILSFNKTYTILNYIKGVDKEQYNMYLMGLDQDIRSELIRYTSIKYFDILPYWAHNIIWGGYFLIGMIFLLKKKSKSILNNTLEIPVKQPNETLNDFANRIKVYDEKPKSAYNNKTEKLHPVQLTAKEQAIEQLKDLQLEAMIALRSPQHLAKNNPKLELPIPKSDE